MRVRSPIEHLICHHLVVMSNKIATPAQTVTALLDRSARPNNALPIRTSFVQAKDSRGRAAGPGPLAAFVGNGDETGLDLNLLVRSVASGDGEHGYSVRQSSKVWARALQHCGCQITAAAVSKAWGRLEARKMVSRKRSRRLASVTVLREDGSGGSYSHPAEDHARGKGPSAGPTYFQLPFEYWVDGWSNRLTLPGKAMLLVSLSLPDDFALPVERTPEWYGWSADTALRGFNELARAKLLGKRRESRVAPLAPEGFTVSNHYTLLSPFDRLRVRPKRAKP